MKAGLSVRQKAAVVYRRNKTCRKAAVTTIIASVKKMFVELNYGDNKQLLFNPNCQTRLLLENIKTRCKFPQEMEVDLSDEYGNLKNISQSPIKYANEILSVDRERLVLIEVKRTVRRNDRTPDSSDVTTVDGDSPVEDVTYTPLLNNGSIVTAKFTARLSRRDSPPSRSESRSRRPREKKEKAIRRSYDSNGGSADRNDGSSSSATGGRKSGQNRSRQSTTPRKGKSKKK